MTQNDKSIPANVRRGSQANVPLRAGIIGGGNACDNLLTILADDRMGALNLEILGVADPNSDAPGMQHANDLGIFTTGDFAALYELPGLNLLIELTGIPAVRDKVAATKPANVSTIDYLGARLLWDMFQLESEKLALERETEEAVRRERDWIQKVLDSLPDQITVLDPQRNVVSVNKTFLELSGLLECDVLGRKCYETKPCPAIDDPSGGSVCPFREVMHTGEPCSTVFSFENSEGELVYHEVSAAPVFDQGGKVIQVIEGVRDVTRRIRLERELRETEQRLSQFLEAAQDIVCIKDMNQRYVYVNPAAAELNSMLPEEMIGKTDYDLFPPRVAAAMAEHDQKIVESGTPVGFYEGMKVRGELRYFQTVRYPIVNDQDEIVALSVMARDVTEERALQEQVRRNKEYMENILQHSSDMIITTDLEGNIVTFSPAGERMLGYSPGELIGKSIEELWRDPEERRLLMDGVQTKGAVNNFNGTLLAKDGRPVEISLSLALLRDSYGKVLGTVGISKDVTEENRLRAQLIEAERLAAIGQTVAGLAHCIKNILNGLKGGSYLVNTGLRRNDSDLINDGWNTVQKSINRIGNLSLDMLNYSRERDPELKETDPVDMLESTVDMVMKAAELEGVRIKMELEAKAPVQLDPIAMSRAVMNLVVNAVDACKEKEYGPDDWPEVVLSSWFKGDDLLIRVADNGGGMSKDMQIHLFQRFFSTKGSRGTGLGLAVTHKIVSEHGGSIDVASEPDKGSRFTIRLPYAAVTA